MTNDLKNFLEVKLKEVEDNTNLLRGLPNDDEALDLIMKTYTEVSNFVLDLVEKKVEKIEVKKFGRYTIEKDAEEIINTIVNETKKCVSTIINNLRV